MNKFGYLFFISLFGFMNMMCTNEKKCSGVAERIDSLLNVNYADDAPGCAIMICKNDSIIYQSARGIADVRSREPITLNTVFNIASITKQFTTVAILKLQEMNMLSVEDNVAKFFPEFKSDIWKRVKLKHLMSHSSGVPDKRPRVDKEFMLYINDSQCLGYMMDLDELKFEPGTNYDYINPTFQLLAEVVHRVSGLDFETFQHENIFKPSNMQNVRYFDPSLKIPNVAHGYIDISATEKNTTDTDSKKDKGRLHVDYIDADGHKWMEFDYGEETFFGTKADGGIYTSVNDFMNWERALMYYQVLQNTSIMQAYIPHMIVSNSPYCMYQNRPHTGYGYGWFIDNTPEREQKIYHTGDNGGFQAYAAKYPKSKVNVIMFENRNDIDRWTMQTMIEKILIEEGIVETYMN